MNSASTIAPHILAQLRSAFSRLERMEGNPGDYSDETWAALLEQRECADALTNDSFLRGFMVGALDALGVSVPEAVQVLRTTPKTRRRIAEFKKTWREPRS